MITIQHTGPACLLLWQHCEVCGRPYVQGPDHDGHGCQDACREQLVQRQRLERRVCAYTACQKVFEVPAMVRRRYCGDECRAQAQVARGPKFFQRARRSIRHESELEMWREWFKAKRAKRQRRVDSMPTLPEPAPTEPVPAPMGLVEQRDREFAAIAEQRRLAHLRRNALLLARYGRA